MRIPCQALATTLITHLKEEIKDKKASRQKLKLATFLLSDAPEQLSYVKIKTRLANQLGIEFELIRLTSSTNEHDFTQLLLAKSQDISVTGIIIQQPIPATLNLKKIYDLIPPAKEIEGFSQSSPFYFPLSLAVLAGLKFVYGGQYTDDRSIVDLPADQLFFQQALKNKRITIAGRGLTGGKMIAKTFDRLGIKYTQTHSQTPNLRRIYQQSDIIITAVGKQIIKKEDIKKGVVLLNVGLRKEEGKLKGDYEEEDIEPIASFYTQTPGGLGPLDVLYLYKNLVKATEFSS